MENKDGMDSKPKKREVKDAKDGKDVKDVKGAKEVKDVKDVKGVHTDDDGNSKKATMSLLNDFINSTKKDDLMGQSSDGDKNAWININNEYLFPRSFLENCVVFVQRSGSTLIIRTTEDYNDLTTVLPTESAAINTIRDICALLNDHHVTCNIDFAGGIGTMDGVPNM